MMTLNTNMHLEFQVCSFDRNFISLEATPSHKLDLPKCPHVYLLYILPLPSVLRNSCSCLFWCANMLTSLM